MQDQEYQQKGQLVIHLEHFKLGRLLFVSATLSLCFGSQALMAAKPDPASFAIGGISRASLVDSDDHQSESPGLTLADFSKTFDHLSDLRKTATQRGSWALIALALAILLCIPGLLRRRTSYATGYAEESGPEPVEEMSSTFLLMWSSPAKSWVLVERSGPNGRARTVAELREGTVVGGAMLAKDPAQRYRLSADHIWRPTDEDERLITNQEEEPLLRQSKA